MFLDRNALHFQVAHSFGGEVLLERNVFRNGNIYSKEKVFLERNVFCRRNIFFEGDVLLDRNRCLERNLRYF